MIIKTSLEQFDTMLWSYRAEIIHKGIMYKLWKEQGRSRRLEIWRVGEYVPEFHISMDTWNELRLHLPEQIRDCDDWKVFVLLPSGE